MRNKRFLIILIAVMLVALCVVGVAFTYSWYRSSPSERLGLNLKADGFVIIYFDEGTSVMSQPLQPAVVDANAITTNNPDGIVTPATQVRYDAVLQYYNDSETNPGGSKLTFDANAKIFMPDKTVVPVVVDRELSVVFNLSVLSYGETGTTDTYTLHNGEHIIINESAMITVSLTVTMLLNDELCDPAFLTGITRIFIAISASLPY